MSWIRIETSLPRSPKMHRLARLLKIDRMHAVGLALTWLAWLDEQTVDGCSGLTPEELDSMLGLQGVADALQAIGWCEIDEAGEVRAVDWEQYNGETAKQRALSARRMARKRLRGSYDKSVTDALPKESVTDALPREEKNIYSSPTCPRARACEEGGEFTEPTLEQVIAIVGRMPYGNMDAEERERCAHAFLCDMQGRGWVDVRGLPVHDWTAAASAYAQRWATNLAKDAARDAARQRVADERTALMAKDIDSKVQERQQRMDPTLRPRMDCNYGARYDM
ncbi:MAG: hypothetical protein MR894_03455 [Akkermansia muciniphila]|nr:hypothetical protein [Akkermansia muciniphila]